MKKMMAMASLVSVINTGVYANTVTADKIQKITLGADYWLSSAIVDDQDYDSDAALSWYADLRHHVAYLPNVKLRYTEIENEAIAFNNIDYIFYYSALNTDNMVWDIGLSFSQLQQGTYLLGSKKQSFDEIEWAFYSAAQLRIEETPFHIIGDMKFGGGGDQSIVDVMAGVSYEYPLEQANVTLTTGYRVLDYSLDYFIDKPVEVKQEGFFVGVAASF